MQYFFLFFILLSVYSIKDDGFNMYFDLTGMLDGYQNFQLVKDGVFQSEVAKFADNLVIPNNVTLCKLSWYTYTDPAPNYQVIIHGVPESVMSVRLSVPQEGSLPMTQQDFEISFVCHVPGKHKMYLQVLVIKDGNEIGGGFVLQPTKECLNVTYDTCPAYSQEYAMVGQAGQSKFEISTLNFYESTTEVEKRITDLISHIPGNIIVLGGITTTEARNLIIQKEKLPIIFRLPYPRSSTNESSNSLFLLSRYPFVRCNYVDFDGYPNQYGAVITTIYLLRQRSLIVIGSVFPPVNNETDFDDLLKPVLKALADSYTEYSQKYPEVDIEVIFVGDIGFDSGTKEEVSSQYQDLLSSLNGIDLYASTNPESLPATFDKKRTSVIIKITKIGNTQINSYMNATVGETKEAISANDYSYTINNKIVKLNQYSPHSSVSISVGWKISKAEPTLPADRNPNDISCVYSPILLLICVILSILL